MKCTCGHAIGHPLVPKCICEKPEMIAKFRYDKIAEEALFLLNENKQLRNRIAELEVTKFHLEGDINRLEDQVNELLVAKHFKDMGRTK